MNEPETARHIVKRNSAPVGQKFGRLTVIGEIHRGKGRAGRYEWICRCECGNERVVAQSALRTGHTVSCGCYNRERVSKTHRRHGMSHLPVYLNWQTMIQRCENPKTPNFKNYGGRGITVCERWKVFENFYADMGEKPSPAYSIDRKDNDKGYSPDNCRWATRREQLLNTRRSIAKRARETGEALMAAYDHTRSKAKLNPAKTMAKLLAMRSDVGADTPAGHRISNIDEVRQNKAKAAGDPVQAAHLDASMARQLRDLEATRHPK